MIKSRIIRATAVAATSLGLVAGLTNIAGASSSGNVSDTGPYSTNTVKSITKSHVNVSNSNHLFLTSDNMQQSMSGSANVSGNTNGGSASSGATSNSNSLNATVHLTNTAPNMTMVGGGSGSNTGTISDTGPHSDNKVVSVNKTSVDVNNDNSICLTTNNEQSATSGSSNVSGNTNGGSATTGSASNTSSSTVSLTVSN